MFDVLVVNRESAKPSIAAQKKKEKEAYAEDLRKIALMQLEQDKTGEYHSNENKSESGGLFAWKPDGPFGGKTNDEKGEKREKRSKRKTEDAQARVEARAKAYQDKLDAQKEQKSLEEAEEQARAVKAKKKQSAARKQASAQADKAARDREDLKAKELEARLINVNNFSRSGSVGSSDRYQSYLSTRAGATGGVAGTAGGVNRGTVAGVRDAAREQLAQEEAKKLQSSRPTSKSNSKRNEQSNGSRPNSTGNNNRPASLGNELRPMQQVQKETETETQTNTPLKMGKYDKILAKAQARAAAKSKT